MIKYDDPYFIRRINGYYMYPYIFLMDGKLINGVNLMILNNMYLDFIRS
jgi:hypothetical protein